jgi:hypothetical protein
MVEKGKPVFREGAGAKTLRLADTKRLRSGVVVLFYEPTR